MGDTKITWADKVWNPVTGCTKVSDGCRNCYAERMSKRLAGRAGYPEDGFKVTLHPDKLDEPLRWKKPARIFVCSMGDLFHEDVTDSFLVDVMKTIRECQYHTFLVLTKRPTRMQAFFRRFKNLQSPSAPLKNLWLGVSVEDQKTADERIPILLETPAAKRFVSIEPMLGQIDLHKKELLCKAWSENKPTIGIYLDWVILGGESGPGARPLHPEWARTVRDQCAETKTPFFFKQWGEWMHEFPTGISLAHRAETFQHGQHFYRVGKKVAGCLLDGKEHKERP